MARRLYRVASIAARSAVRGTRCSTTTDSWAACAPSPTAPSPSSVGTPSADVDVGVGVLGDDIGAGSAGDDAGIDGAADAQIREPRDCLQQPREFEDRGVAALEVDAAVRRDSGDVQVVIADAFAGGLAGEALRGFEDEDCGGLQREPLGDGAGNVASDLFVAIQQDRDRAADFEVGEDA